jgi:hypothetical protein
MEQRPDHTVRKSLVVAVDLGLGEKDGNDIGGGELRVELGALRVVEPADVAGPANPGCAGLPMPAAQPCRQSTARVDEAHGVPFEPRRNGQSVRDDDEA